MRLANLNGRTTLLCGQGGLDVHTASGGRFPAGRGANMIFPVPVPVSYLSSICRLLPGDLIFTGTPGGVGNRRTPPRYLLESTIEHVGTMRHRFHDRKGASDGPALH